MSISNARSPNLVQRLDSNHLEIAQNEFDKDYYENGVASGKSGYSHYRWIPELTIPMAHNFTKLLHLQDKDKVLDYGCAKGFLVKAFTLLNINAFGCDISPYAVEHADADIRNKVKLYNGEIPFEENFKWIIAKDVLEHIPKEDLPTILGQMRQKSNHLYAVVPLGDGQKYIVPEYEGDITHRIRECKEWWEQTFEQNGWNVTHSTYLVKGLKDNWSHYKKGNGFFSLERE
jgi:SAM-dependent methyltransferase